VTPETLFSRRVAADPTSPMLTFYDDASGERAELSGKSLANWVAKTHFLLTDELGLIPGDRVFVTMPVHWLTAPVLFGSWFAGLEVISEPGHAAVAFGDAESLAQSDLSAVDDVYAVSLLSMARSAEAPRGMSDYAASVRPQPDAWAAVQSRADAEQPALNGRSRLQVVADAREAAAELALSDGARLMWTQPDFDATAWVHVLLAPLIVGGSSVLVRHADLAKLDDRAAAEQVSVTR
jgi:uncharacterized protein (TIGR03089 family)